MKERQKLIDVSNGEGEGSPIDLKSALLYAGMREREINFLFPFLVDRQMRRFHATLLKEENDA